MPPPARLLVESDLISGRRISRRAALFASVAAFPFGLMLFDPRSAEREDDIVYTECKRAKRGGAGKVWDVDQDVRLLLRSSAVPIARAAKAVSCLSVILKISWVSQTVVCTDDLQMMVR